MGACFTWYHCILCPAGEHCASGTPTIGATGRNDSASRHGRPAPGGEMNRKAIGPGLSSNSNTISEDTPQYNGAVYRLHLRRILQRKASDHRTFGTRGTGKRVSCPVRDAFSRQQRARTTTWQVAVRIGLSSWLIVGTRMGRDWRHDAVSVAFPRTSHHPRGITTGDYAMPPK